MSNIKDIFSPLDAKYCMYFYYLSVFWIVMLAFTVISYVMVGFSKRLGVEHYLNMFSLSLAYFVWYFQNRLFYSMCSRSI